MKIEIQKEWYSVEQCLANPNKLYVFGDNSLRIGKGGQAQIRDCKNSYGIATKYTPRMDNEAFFSDKPDQAEIVFNDIKELYEFYITDKTDIIDTIVFPADGLGTGLSEMPLRSPKMFKWLHETISLLFDINYIPFNK